MRFLFLSFLLLTSCLTLKPDQAPSPIDPTIQETRLEFRGCGFESQVGTIACVPGQMVAAVTEFPGDIIYFSSGSACSIRQQMRATPPLTVINYPSVSSLCEITVYYLPTYPNQAKFTYPVRGMFGGIFLQPDFSYRPSGSLSLTTTEIVSITIPDVVRGAFISRQFQSPVSFTGDTLSFKPTILGTDLIQVKVWKNDGTIEQKVYTANYFSPYALQLSFDIKEMAQKNLLQLTYTDAVSVISVKGKITVNYWVTVPKTFTGIVRAYSVQGRTLITYLEQGVVKWTR